MTDGTDTFAADDGYAAGPPRPTWSAPREWWRAADDDVRVVVVVVAVDALAVVVMLAAFLARVVPHLV